MQCEHWLEAADPKHRYGTNLRPYFDYWLTQHCNGCEIDTTYRTPAPLESVPSGGVLPSISQQGDRATPHLSGQLIPGDGAAMNRSDDAVYGTVNHSQWSGNPTVCEQPAGADAHGHDVTVSPGVASSTTPRRSHSAPMLQDMEASTSTTKATHVVRSSTMQREHTDHRFFNWLDEGSGRHVDLAERGVPRSKLESERVQYLSEDERDHLEVTVQQETGLLIYKISGQVVHTGSEMSLVHAATTPAQLGELTDIAGPSGGGDAVPNAHNGMLFVQQPQQADSTTKHKSVGVLELKEKPCKWIYVLDTDGRLFVHAKYRGKFHHSSFLQGGAVLSAGGIVVDHGCIMKLTADSGHYRPHFESFMATVQMLKDWGADLRHTKLSAKHIKCPMLTPLNE